MQDPRQQRIEKRLIHYYLIDNIIKGLDNKQILSNTINSLKQHGVERKASSLYLIKRLLIKNPELHCLPSLINKEPSNYREEKEKLYSAFWRMTQMEVRKDESVAYVGLPSNQIGNVWKNLKKITDSFILTSCEIDKEKADWQEKYVDKFLDDRCSIFNKNVFTVIDNLLRTETLILDLDLMITGDLYLSEKIAAIISKLEHKKIIINITTSIGRNITENEYILFFRKKLERLISENKELQIKYWFSGKYIDNVIPMAWEHIVLRKKGGKNE